MRCWMMMLTMIMIMCQSTTGPCEVAPPLPGSPLIGRFLCLFSSTWSDLSSAFSPVGPLPFSVAQVSGSPRICTHCITLQWRHTITHTAPPKLFMFVCVREKESLFLIFYITLTKFFEEGLLLHLKGSVCDCCCRYEWRCVRTHLYTQRKNTGWLLTRRDLAHERASCFI